MLYQIAPNYLHSKQTTNITMQYSTVSSPGHGETSPRSRVLHTLGYVKTRNSKLLKHYGNHNNLFSLLQYDFQISYESQHTENTEGNKSRD